MHTLTQQHLPPPLTSTVKLSLLTHAHSSPLSLAARSHRCRANCSCFINNGGTFSGQTSYVQKESTAVHPTLPAWSEPPASSASTVARASSPPSSPPAQSLHPVARGILLNVSWIPLPLYSKPSTAPTSFRKSQSPSRGPQSPKICTSSIISLTSPPLTPSSSTGLPGTGRSLGQSAHTDLRAFAFPSVPSALCSDLSKASLLTSFKTLLYYLLSKSCSDLPILNRTPSLYSLSMAFLPGVYHLPAMERVHLMCLLSVSPTRMQGGDFCLSG